MATKFCRKHDLDEAAIEILAENIEENIRTALQEKEPLFHSFGDRKETENSKISKAFQEGDKENITEWENN